MTDLRTPHAVRDPLATAVLPSSNGLRMRPKRPGRLILALLLVVGSITVALTIYVRIGDRQDVLAVTRTVLAGEQLVISDFRVVSISTDDDLAAVVAADRELLVGQFARVRIAEGSLVVASSTQPTPLVDPDRILMSVTVPLGGVPTGLREGSRLALIVTPGAAMAPDQLPVLVEATVAAVPRNLAELVGGDSPGSSQVALSVEVDPGRAALIGSAESVAVGVLDPSAPFPVIEVAE